MSNKSASQKTTEYMRSEGIDEMRIKSFFPIDPDGCECQGQVNYLKEKMANMSSEELEEFKENRGAYNCPKDKENYNKYKITCDNCNEDIATLYAKSKEIGTDWCDLHYICKAVRTRRKTVWKGCMAVNISPGKGELGFECSCGADTRHTGAKGKDFNKEDSKFNVAKI